MVYKGALNMEITYAEYLKSMKGIESDFLRPEFDFDYLNKNFYLDYWGGNFEISHNPDPYYYIKITDTQSLCKLADDLRDGKGYERILGSDNYYKDDDIYYDFYISFHKSGLIELSFIVAGDDRLDDDNQEYFIDLDKNEQGCIYNHFVKKIESEYGTVLKMDPNGKISWRIGR